MSIYDEIGGEAAVSATVDEFYRRVVADPKLAPYFEGTDMKRLKGHQRAFIAAAVGGPERYLGRNMAEAHARLNVTASDFDRVVGHLVDTLAALDVSTPIINAIGGKLAPLKDEIVRGPAARAG